MVSEWKVYSPVTGQMPPESTPVMGYNPSWVDEDFNPRGIRECFRTGDGTEWVSARWTDGCDTYETDEGPPTHYYEIPDLEAAPQPGTLEPVAWMYEVINGNAFSSDKGEPVCIGWDEETDEPVYGKVTPLYTHPPAQPDTATEPSCELCQEGWPKMGKMHYSDIGALRCKKESTIYTQCPDEGCPQYGTGSTCNSCKLDTVAVERDKRAEFERVWPDLCMPSDEIGGRAAKSKAFSAFKAGWQARALLDQEK